MLTPSKEPLAVLVSGGLDSAILLGEALRYHPVVQPLYVRCGLYWEDAEQHALDLFLQALAAPNLRPVVKLHVPVADLYDSHWSLTGRNVPDARSPDEAVFLPGRNVLLLAKAILWCHLRDVAAVAMAPLESNPFPDASPAFFAAYQAVVNESVDGHVRVLQPYLGLHKVDVVKRGRDFPLQWTFSCLRPLLYQHCGSCNKCAERRKGFADAGIVDPTDYHEG